MKQYKVIYKSGMEGVTNRPPDPSPQIDKVEFREVQEWQPAKQYDFYYTKCIDGRYSDGQQQFWASNAEEALQKVVQSMPSKNIVAGKLFKNTIKVFEYNGMGN